MTLVVHSRKEVRSAVIGMLCGNGNIHQNSLRITHFPAQLPYLEFKRDILQLKQVPMIGIDSFNNNGYPGVRLATRSRPIYRIMRNRFYIKDGKKITRKILNLLCPLGLAIWYQDGGGLSAKKRNGKIHSYEVFLNTHLSQSANQVIIDYFNEVWNIKWSQVLNNGLYRLRMGVQEGRKFAKIVEPYIVPCMRYKIEPLVFRAPGTPPLRRG